MVRAAPALIAAGSLVAMGCMQLLHTDSGQRAPASPPAARGQDCLGTDHKCQEGLTCVEYTSNLGGVSASCEIPCSGGACPDGMTCGDKHSPIYGPGPANVCL